MFLSRFSHHISSPPLSPDAFVKAMERYGFSGVNAFDIVDTGMKVREELAETDPEKAAGL